MIQQERLIVPHNMTSSFALASIREYLYLLRESGLEGIPTDSPDKMANMLKRIPDEAAFPEYAPSSTTTDHLESLETIRKDLGDCQRCDLAKKRKNLVFGVGNPYARLVFVGEGPGADEDAQGEPFVGEAGRLLNRLVMAMGLQREEVYICNVIKCRPPGNRDPNALEIEACSPFMLRQIRAIGPDVIVGLGKFAVQTLLQTKVPITKLRGIFRAFYGIPLMPTLHPSYLLRRRQEGDMDSFWRVWDDMTQVLQLLKLPIPEKIRKK